MVWVNEISLYTYITFTDVFVLLKFVDLLYVFYSVLHMTCIYTFFIFPYLGLRDAIGAILFNTFTSILLSFVD